MFKKIDKEVIELVGAAIAIVMCNAEGSLDALRPYQRLSELGHEREMLAPELTNWIHNGTLSQGAPVPRPERAGTSQSTFEERRDAALAYLETQEAEFKEDVLTTNPADDVRSYGLSWELRNEIMTALHDLKTSVTSMRAVRSGT